MSTYGLALAYEDLVDHDQLRHDPAFTAALGRPERALAGKSTLDRLEHAAKIGAERNQKLETAACGTIRLQLLKIGALVTVSVRRVTLAFASSCPASPHLTPADE